jgi:hypothetical protein
MTEKNVDPPAFGAFNHRLVYRNRDTVEAEKAIITFTYDPLSPLHKRNVFIILQNQTLLYQK